MPTKEDKTDYRHLDFKKLNFYKVYSGKPTIYLDQNILDKIVSYPSLAEGGSFLGYEYQVIYSNETLNEIERSGQADKFLRVLEKLGARRISFEVDKNLKRNGKVVIDPYISPFETYDDYINRDQMDKIASKIVENQVAFVFHMITDKDSQNVSEYIKGDTTSFEEINEYIIESMELVRNEIPEDIYILLLKIIRDSFQKMTEQLAIFQNIMLMNMVESGIDIDSNNGQDGIKKIEETTGISGKVLNNIEAPNVLEKIYNLYKTHPDFSKLSIHEFYLISDNKDSHKLYKFEKVSNIYLMLNLIGYKRDKGFSKKYERLVSAQSDAQHLSYACYCSFFFSEDKSFVDKAKAIFNFLNINSEAVKVSFNVNYETS